MVIYEANVIMKLVPSEMIMVIYEGNVIIEAGPFRNDYGYI
jgi:hypothetical protein